MSTRERLKQGRLRFFAGLHVDKATKEQVWFLRKIGVQKVCELGIPVWKFAENIYSKVIPDNYREFLEHKL